MKSRSRILLFAASVVVLLVVGTTVGLGYFVWRELPKTQFAPLDALPEIGSLSAERCRSCHATIYDEWAATHHGQAVSDPLYQADLEHEGHPFFCNHCHAPLLEQQPRHVHGLLTAWPSVRPLSTENPRYVPALQREGVTCVVCHQREGAMLGPLSNLNSPHPTRTTSALQSEALCAGCHTLDLQRLGHLNRPIMETLTEWRQYRTAGGDKVCVDCHMPPSGERVIATGGPPRPSRSHRLRGPFDAEFVKTAVEVRRAEITVERDTVGARIDLFNATGHRLPTADPNRRFDVVLELVDASDKILDRTAVSIERKVDPHTLKEPAGSDTTLAPRETRPLGLSLPRRAGAKTVRLSLMFWPWKDEDTVAKRAGVVPEQIRMRLFLKETTLE